MQFRVSFTVRLLPHFRYHLVLDKAPSFIKNPFLLHSVHNVYDVTLKDFNGLARELPKGLFLAGILLMAWMLVFALVVRGTALPQVEEYLPLDETQAFWIADRNVLLSTPNSMPNMTSSFMGTPLSELSWIQDLGTAWVDGQTIEIASVHSLSEGRAFLQGLLLEGEEWGSQKANSSLWSEVTCYTQGQPYCFTWVGELLFVAGSADLLKTVQEVARGAQPNLEQSEHYQNGRGRLAQWNGAFYYVDINKIKTRFTDDFGALSALLELFPMTAGVIKEEGGLWIAENFLAVDKNQQGGEAFYSPTEKYEQKLLPWTSEDLAFEWGGQNLAEQFFRMEKILSVQSPASGLVFASTLEAKLKNWFGADFVLEDESSLLDKEQYFGFTPEGDFLALIELENDEELHQAGMLKDRFVNQGLVWTPALEVSMEDHLGIQVYHFRQGGDEKLSAAFLPELVVVSGSKKRLLSTLDKVLGQAPLRDLQKMEAILSGSDELLNLHCPFLPDGSILKALFGANTVVHSTRKLFDDGVFTRTHVTR